MNAETILYGEKIQLVPMTGARWHDFYKNYVIDPMMDTTPYAYDFDRAEKAYRLKSTDATRLYFSIAADEKNIGMIYLKHINSADSTAEVGIALVNDPVKGNGFGTEAIQLLIQYAFDALQLKSLAADSVLRNTRSQHVLEKAGFRYTHEDEIFKYYKIEKAE